MPENEEEITSLRKRVEALENNFSSLENNLRLALQNLGELMGEDGQISLDLKKINKDMSDLRASVRTSDDTLGDFNTISALATALEEIKFKLGIR